MASSVPIAAFYPTLTTANGQCMTMYLSGDGSVAAPWVLQGNVRISPRSGNGLSCLNDGLYVSGPSRGKVTVADTETMNLSISGTGSDTDPYIIRAQPVISPDIGNALVMRYNGLYAISSGGGAGSIQGSESTCTKITITGRGVTENPFIISATAKISEKLGNVLKCLDDGLFVQDGRDVYVYQGEGATAPNPASYYLWVDGSGQLMATNGNRTQWQTVNDTFHYKYPLTIDNGIVTIPYRTSSSASGIGLNYDESEFTLLVNANITDWLTYGGTGDAFRHNFRILLTYDGTPRTVSWPAHWKWARMPTGFPKVPPAPTATMDIVVESFSDDGGTTQYAQWNYYGTAANHP